MSTSAKTQSNFNMVDPYKVTNYQRTLGEAEEFLLFCIVVAGKTAVIQAKKLDQLLENLTLTYGVCNPFILIKESIRDGNLRKYLETVKMGQYGRLERAFDNVVNLHAPTCSLEDLEAIPGIGMKTSRFFVVHSRANQPYAILDTHILAYMRKHKIGKDVPKVTPSSRAQYLRLEKSFLNHLRKRGIKDVAEFDLQVWSANARL